MTEPPRERLLLYGAVALGTAIGGTARAGLSLAMPALAGGLPWPTLLANGAGSFLIGLYAALTAPEGRLPAGIRTQHFVMTGLCGGFTSFSIFTLESLRLAQTGRLGLAGAHVALAAVLWMTAVWLGYAAGERFNRLGGGRPQHRQ